MNKFTHRRHFVPCKISMDEVVYKCLYYSSLLSGIFSIGLVNKLYITSFLLLLYASLSEGKVQD